MQDSKIKDPTLAAQGRLQIEWASNHMPVLMLIKRRFAEEQPFKNISLGACLHVTKETAVLIETFLSGGAQIALCGSNPLSTQDDVSAALVGEGVHVFAWRGQTRDEYYWCIEQVLVHEPKFTLDDGADLISILHSKMPGLLSKVDGGTEETTTGVIRLRAMAKAAALKYPIIAVNDAYTKHLFDNRFGTGQSTLDGILRATNILLAGKSFVVCGFGWCGRGIAMRAQGMGASVIVTEVDPLKALEAAISGFRVMPMADAATLGDIFVTATGDINVIRKEHMQAMKDGAILANSGHFNVEVNARSLEGISTSKRTIRSNLDEYTLLNGKRLYLLAEGRLVNLSAAEGHPSEVMDMSFANQALCIEHLVKSDKRPAGVYSVPAEIDQKIAALKLASMEINIDELTDEQKKYLAAWDAGTI